jgi:hypothetical protein
VSVPPQSSNTLYTGFDAVTAGGAVMLVLVVMLVLALFNRYAISAVPITC